MTRKEYNFPHFHISILSTQLLKKKYFWEVWEVLSFEKFEKYFEKCSPSESVVNGLAWLSSPMTIYWAFRWLYFSIGLIFSITNGYFCLLTHQHSKAPASNELQIVSLSGFCQEFKIHWTIIFRWGALARIYILLWHFAIHSSYFAATQILKDLFDSTFSGCLNLAQRPE